MNIKQVIGITIAVAGLLEIATRGELGPYGIVIALVIAVIITLNTKKRKQPPDPLRDGAPGGSANYGSSDGATTRAGWTDPHLILGVDPKYSDEQISKAYHALVRQWHPDHLEGMADELRQHANRRLAEINEAFEQIMSSRRKTRHF